MVVIVSVWLSLGRMILYWLVGLIGIESEVCLLLRESDYRWNT